MTAGVPNLTAKPVCPSQQTLGMELDCLCFFFLIVQQRIFKSFHFFHLVNEAKAQTILADRGLGDLLVNQMLIDVFEKVHVLLNVLDRKNGKNWMRRTQRLGKISILSWPK